MNIEDVRSRISQLDQHISKIQTKLATKQSHLKSRFGDSSFSSVFSAFSKPESLHSIDSSLISPEAKAMLKKSNKQASIKEAKTGIIQSPHQLNSPVKIIEEEKLASSLDQLQNQLLRAREKNNIVDFGKAAGLKKSQTPVNLDLASKRAELESSVSFKTLLPKSPVANSIPEEFDHFIDKVAKDASKEFSVKLDPKLVESVIKQESGFNVLALSKTGAKGLMQLMPDTAKEMGVFNPYNPYQNVKGGARYLAKMLKMHDGNLKHSLAAYNAGAQNVRQYGGVPPFPETQNYVKNILADYQAKL